MELIHELHKLYPTMKGQTKEYLRYRRISQEKSRQRAIATFASVYKGKHKQGVHRYLARKDQPATL